MALTGMLKMDEEAVICDMAETYKVLDMYSLPLFLFATLACGLPKNSRIMTRLSGVNVPFNDMILGRLLDTVSYVLYTLQVLGGAKPQEPKSVVEAMIGVSNGKEASFMTREDFEKERKLIMKTGKEVKDGDRTWESICADHPIG